jgi:uncharacterized membrane protein (DUF373 family)
VSERNDSPPRGRLDRVINRFERAVVVALIVMMMLVVGVGTLDLARKIVSDLWSPPIALLQVDELLDVFGFFLLILIGLELLETIKAYLNDKMVHVEVVLEVALIAVARKIIVLDLSKHDGVTILAIAALIIALSSAFLIVLLRRRIAGPPG